MFDAYASFLFVDLPEQDYELLDEANFFHLPI